MGNGELVDDLKSIYASYPRWMDKASYNQSQEFKQLVDEAKLLVLRSAHDHLWVVRARGLLREHDNLCRSLKT